MTTENKSRYDRFRPTALNDLKERKKEVAEVTNQYDNESDGRIRRSRIKEDGTYIIRMFPSHPIKGANSIETKAIYYLPGYVNKKDANGKWIENKDKPGTYEQTIGVRSVFDARVHGGATLDLIDTYISLAKKKAEQLYPDDKEKQKNYLLPITGNKFQGGVYQGINLSRSYLFYGELIKHFGLDNEEREFFEFEGGRAIEKGIYKTAALESNNDPLGTDGCFTDPLEGRPVRIIVDSAAGRLDPASWYSVSITNEKETINIDGKMKKVDKEYPISEEQLTWFEEEVEPLINYRTKFTHRDLQIQLKGLELFDAEHKFNLIEEEEFGDAYQYLEDLFPFVENEKQEQNNDVTNTKSKSADEFDLMDLAELKQYIKDNKLGLVVLPRYSEDDLKEMIRAILNQDAEEESKEVGVEDSSNDVDQTKADSQSENTVVQSQDWRDRIKGLQNKVESES